MSWIDIQTLADRHEKLAARVAALETFVRAKFVTTGSTVTWFDDAGKPIAEAQQGKGESGVQGSSAPAASQTGDRAPSSDASPEASASPAAPPAFKKGDRVRHIADGWTGIVRQGAMQRVKYSDHIQVEWDDGAGPATGLFPPSDFTLLAPAPIASPDVSPAAGEECEQCSRWKRYYERVKSERDEARRERDEARAQLAWFREWLEKAKEAPHAD